MSALGPPAQACPAAATLDVVGQKWTLLIIREALTGTSRFSDFEAALGLSKNLLAGRLRLLCEHGLLETEPYEVPGDRPRVRYRLTDTGRALAPVLAALGDWGRRHLPASDAWGEPARCACGGGVHAVLVCEKGHVATQPDAPPTPIDALHVVKNGPVE